MLAEVNVDEADIANIEPEQRARVFAIAFPDRQSKAMSPRSRCPRRSPRAARG